VVKLAIRATGFDAYGMGIGNNRDKGKFCGLRIYRITQNAFRRRHARFIK
jgi:hypothetical protein